MSPPAPPRRPRATYKTYSHLLGERRVPSDYELLTSRLLYYPGRGFEVDVPLGEWYRRHQQGSPLRCGDWERFRDPRETTYARYTALARDREVFVDGLLQSIEDRGSDARLAGPWVATLGRVLGPLRYPLHGQQMIAAYVGQMAPSGRITVAALLQAADQVRRIQRVAYRLAQLTLCRPDLAADSKRAWQQDPMWQPLRAVIERLLVAYDWGEALVGLNLCVGPIFDDLFLLHFPALGAAQGDPLLREIAASLYEDGRWHRHWTAALLQVALADEAHQADSRAAAQGWVDRWLPPALQAAGAFAPLFPGGFDEIQAALLGAAAAALGELGLRLPDGAPARGGAP